MLIFPILIYTHNIISIKILETKENSNVNMSHKLLAFAGPVIFISDRKLIWADYSYGGFLKLSF